MAQIKPIETEYKGYRFRSRLEARWAVFFTRLGLKWEYEPEGYTLPSGKRYLPDFLVQTPQGNPIYYEIKPVNGKSDGRFEEFSKVEERGRAALLRGDPVEAIKTTGLLWPNGDFGSGITVCPRCGGVNLWRTVEASMPGYDVDFGCGPCDFETPCGGGHEPEPGMFDLPVTPYKGVVQIGLRDYDTFRQRVTEAALAARQARFEYGEVPA